MCEVDTRAITRHLRERGAMRVGISSVEADAGELLERVRAQPEMSGAFLADQVSTTGGYRIEALGEPRFRVVAVDLGIKSMTPHRMAERGIEVHVLPATATIDQVRALEPDGVFFSNGPGDPGATDGPVELVKATLAAGIPFFGICFGNQLFGRALGFGTYKLGLRSPRHQPAGDGPEHPQGRGHRAQPRVRRGRAAAGRDAYALRAGPGQPHRVERQRGGGPGAARRPGPDPGLLGPVPPRGRRRPTRRRLPLRPVRRRDGSTFGGEMR